MRPGQIMILMVFVHVYVALVMVRAPSRSALHPMGGAPLDSKRPARVSEVRIISSIVTHGAPPCRVNIAPFPRVVQFVKTQSVLPAVVHEAVSRGCRNALLLPVLREARVAFRNGTWKTRTLAALCCALGACAPVIRASRIAASVLPEPGLLAACAPPLSY